MKYWFSLPIYNSIDSMSKLITPTIANSCQTKYSSITKLFIKLGVLFDLHHNHRNRHQTKLKFGTYISFINENNKNIWPISYILLHFYFPLNFRDILNHCNIKSLIHLFYSWCLVGMTFIFKSSHYQLSDISLQQQSLSYIS